MLRLNGPDAISQENTLCDSVKYESYETMKVAILLLRY